jgi:hypothetical protein
MHLNIVEYRSVVRRWLCKQRPFLGNGSVNMFPLLGTIFLTMRQLEYNNENGVCLHGPCRDVISKGQSQLLVVPCGGGIKYLHRNTASRRRRQKRKSRNWDSKIWSRDPTELGPRMTALARTSSNFKQLTRPLFRDSAPYQQTRNSLAVIKTWS